MSNVKFNENGDLVNADTGELFGHVEGNAIVVNSDGAEEKTLDELGVLEPEIPEVIESQGEDPDLNENNRFVDSLETSDFSSVSITNNCGPTSYSAVKTKYEVTKDSYFVIKFGLFQRDDGRFVPISIDSVDNVSDAEAHWVKFRMWTYREELSWKSACLEYSSKTKSQSVNNDKLNEMKIKNLLLDWSFGEFEDSLHLLHCDGRLSDESYNVFMGLYPSIAGTIVELMNTVIERNQ